MAASKSFPVPERVGPPLPAVGCSASPPGGERKRLAAAACAQAVEVSTRAPRPKATCLRDGLPEESFHECATQTKWSFEADFIQACSCDYGCPCEFSAPPTRGFCEGTGVWRIIKGSYGDVSLDGLAVAFIAHWPKAIHEGNGTLVQIIAEHANAQQREAILTICSGQAGGLPFEILATTFTKVLDPIFLPIELNLAGRNTSARVGDVLRIALEPIKNPVTGEPANCASGARDQGSSSKTPRRCPRKSAARMSGIEL
jgi:hypothetical protein